MLWLTGKRSVEVGIRCVRFLSYEQSQWFQFLEKKITGLWKDIKPYKSGHRKNKANASPFWKGVISEREILEIGLNKKLGNGTHMLFWNDRQLGESNLATIYPKPFFIGAGPRDYSGQSTS